MLMNFKFLHHVKVRLLLFFLDKYGLSILGRF